MNTRALSPQTRLDEADPTRRVWLKLGALGLLAPTWLAGCGGGGDSNDAAQLSYSATIADARSAILTAMKNTGTPSISVALFERDRLVWAEAFGTIDKVANTPASTDTLLGTSKNPDSSALGKITPF